jgi:hypothetical protein
MMQAPSPGEIAQISEVVIPIFGMITGITITGFVVLGPVGRAVGRVIMKVFGADRDQALPAGDLRELRDLMIEQGGRLESMQQQLGELAERQDFTERLLAQAREKKVLPEGRAP